MADGQSADGIDQSEEDVTDCEECGEEINFTEADTYWKTADDRFWHDGCYDPTEKLDRAENLRDGLLSLIVAEDCSDGLSDEFHCRLDNVQAELKTAVQRERLKQDQDLVTDGGADVGGTDRCEQCGEPLGDNPRRRIGHSELFCSRECSDKYWSTDTESDREAGDD